ncbi:MAG: hypothetical protein IPO48_09150 [Saprospiraceae bacterium]|nr:hypothetical protein [Saprospiraceae bacterium]
MLGIVYHRHWVISFWEDLNGNGIYEATSETGIPNVTVTLKGTAGNGDIINKNTTTNASRDLCIR